MPTIEQLHNGWEEDWILNEPVNPSSVNRQKERKLIGVVRLNPDNGQQNFIPKNELKKSNQERRK